MMAHRNKTYIAFDGDKDIHYYYLMKAWKHSKHVSFNFYDAHDINNARDSSLEETIKRRLRERMANAKCLVLIIGESTRYLNKFVRWEIELAISSDIPIIAININGKKRMDDNRCPPILKNELAIHIPFKQAIVEYALANWLDSHTTHRSKGESGAYYYKDSVYQQIGI
jgi:hypothetical protein